MCGGVPVVARRGVVLRQPVLGLHRRRGRIGNVDLSGPSARTTVVVPRGRPVHLVGHVGPVTAPELDRAVCTRPRPHRPALVVGGSGQAEATALPSAKSDTSTTAKPPVSGAKYALLPSLLTESECRPPVGISTGCGLGWELPVAVQSAVEGHRRLPVARTGRDVPNRERAGRRATPRRARRAGVAREYRGRDRDSPGPREPWVSA